VQEVTPNFINQRIISKLIFVGVWPRNGKIEFMGRISVCFGANISRKDTSFQLYAKI